MPHDHLCKVRNPSPDRRENGSANPVRDNQRMVVADDAPAEAAEAVRPPVHDHVAVLGPGNVVEGISRRRRPQHDCVACKIIQATMTAAFELLVTDRNVTEELRAACACLVLAKFLTCNG